MFLMATFDYESYPGDYQHKALNSKYWMQRFWHRSKLLLLDNCAPVQKNDVILDIGCGSGNLCFHLSNKCKEIYGVDIKKNAISFCNEKTSEEKINNCHFIRLKDAKLPFSDKFFSKIFLLDVIEHLEDPVSMLNEMRRVLNDTGVIVITTPNYQSLWPVIEFCTDHLQFTPQNEEQHITKFTKKRLNSMLATAGFSPITRSVYFVSPLFPSFRIALKLLDWEQKVKVPGMLLYSIAKKSS